MKKLMNVAIEDAVACRYCKRANAPEAVLCALCGRWIASLPLKLPGQIVDARQWKDFRNCTATAWEYITAKPRSAIAQFISEQEYARGGIGVRHFTERLKQLEHAFGVLCLLGWEKVFERTATTVTESEFMETLGNRPAMLVVERQSTEGNEYHNYVTIGAYKLSTDQGLKAFSRAGGLWIDPGFGLPATVTQGEKLCGAFVFEDRTIEQCASDLKRMAEQFARDNTSQ